MHTGTGLMVVASVVCVIAAVTNDRYFPEARMSQKEAKVMFLDFGPGSGFSLEGRIRIRVTSIRIRNPYFGVSLSQGV